MHGDVPQTLTVVIFCSIEEVLHHVDNAIQYGEDADVKIRDFEAPGGDDDM